MKGLIITIAILAILFPIVVILQRRINKKQEQEYDVTKIKVNLFVILLSILCPPLYYLWEIQQIKKIRNVLIKEILRMIEESYQSKRNCLAGIKLIELLEKNTNFQGVDEETKTRIENKKINVYNSGNETIQMLDTKISILSQELLDKIAGSKRKRKKLEIILNKMSKKYSTE